MTHPSPDTLRDFVTGALDAEGEAEVREHLAAGCEACQATLQAEAALDHAMWEVRQADAAASAVTAAGEDAAVVELPRREPVPGLAWGGALAAAAIALVVVFGTFSHEPSAPPPTVAGVAPAEPAPSALPAQPAGTAAEAKADEDEAKEEEAAKVDDDDKAKEEAKKEPAPSKKAKAKAKTSSRRARARAAPKPPPSPRATKRDCDPMLDVDCSDVLGGGASGADRKTLAPSDVLGVVRKNLKGIQSCGEQHDVSATVRAEWRVLRSGRTTAVRISTARYADTPVGRCIVSEIKRWRFPRYSGDAAPPVKFPFKLRGKR